MRVKDLIRACCLTGLLFTLAGTGHALPLPLAGQTLSASGGYATGVLGPATAVVGTGVEFREKITEGYWLHIDFAEDGLLRVTFDDGKPNLDTDTTLSHYAADNQTFSDTNGTIAEIIGFELRDVNGVKLIQNGSAGITQSDLSFTADSVSLRIGDGTFWSAPGAGFTAQILFEEPPKDTQPLQGISQVFEPGILLLTGVGLAGIGLARRFPAVQSYV